jgi:hypothetical protein
MSSPVSPAEGARLIQTAMQTALMGSGFTFAEVANGVWVAP